jgi:hypothetical protein
MCFKVTIILLLYGTLSPTTMLPITLYNNAQFNFATCVNALMYEDLFQYCHQVKLHVLVVISLEINHKHVESNVRKHEHEAKFYLNTQKHILLNDFYFLNLYVPEHY